MTKYIDYLHFSFPFKITRLISKFTENQNKELFFLGSNSMYVIFNDANILKAKFEEKCIILSSYDLLEIMEKSKTKSNTLSKIQTPPNTVKIFSDNLFKRLIVEECEGDFCEYEFLEKVKGNLQYKINQYPGKKELNYNHRLLGSIFTVKQLEIS